MDEPIPNRLLSSLVLVLAVAAASSGCASRSPADASSDKENGTLEDVIPLTAANLRGHRMLYNEGWFVITSSRKALEYAKEKSIVSWGEAIREARERVRRPSTEYVDHLKGDLPYSLETGKAGVEAGTGSSCAGKNRVSPLAVPTAGSALVERSLILRGCYSSPSCLT